jgi:acyl-CoA thioester hydrolase
MSDVGVVRPVSEARIRVRYAETDQMGVVYHSNYLIWFEVGRVELIRSMGLDYKRMEEEEGCGIAVVDVHVRYRAPARYDDELVVETRLLAARGAVIRFGYRVLRVEDGVLLCEGETVHVVVGKGMKKMSLPPRYAERFAAHLSSPASDA